jgi:hypothetical protein
MDRRRVVAGGLLGAAIGLGQLVLTRRFMHEPTHSDLSGLGQALGRVVTVLAVSLVCLWVAVAVLRLRYWFAVGFAALVAQWFALVLLFWSVAEVGLVHGNAAFPYFLPIALVPVLAFAAHVVPVKPPR